MLLHVSIRCASHLASYIDDLLRTGLNGVSEEEVDSKLEKVCMYVCMYVSLSVCLYVVLTLLLQCTGNRDLQVHL